jgi:hypothetical protein
MLAAIGIKGYKWPRFNLLSFLGKNMSGTNPVTPSGPTVPVTSSNTAANISSDVLTGVGDAVTILPELPGAVSDAETIGNSNDTLAQRIAALEDLTAKTLSTLAGLFPENFKL